MVYVVERYLPGLTRSDLLRGLSRLEQTEDREQSEVRYLGSTIVLEDEACFCQFEGPSEAAIADANRAAGLAFDRITPAVTVTPTERRSEMHVSIPTTPGTVQISRRRLLGVVVSAAVVAAAITGAIVGVTVGGGSTSAAPATPLQQVYSSRVPLLPVIPGAHVVSGGSIALTPQEAKYVQGIVSLTPAQLVAGFGTDVRAAAALASLTPAERAYVESIMALTPAQLRAAFGTN
jgi:hypothetical protein